MAGDYALCSQQLSMSFGSKSGVYTFCKKKKKKSHVVILLVNFRLVNLGPVLTRKLVQTEHPDFDGPSPFCKGMNLRDKLAMMGVRHDQVVLFCSNELQTKSAELVLPPGSIWMHYGSKVCQVIKFINMNSVIISLWSHHICMIFKKNLNFIVKYYKIIVLHNKI